MKYVQTSHEVLNVPLQEYSACNEEYKGKLSLILLVAANSPLTELSLKMIECLTYSCRYRCKRFQRKGIMTVIVSREHPPATLTATHAHC